MSYIFDYDEMRKALEVYDRTGNAITAAKTVGATSKTVMRWVRCRQLYGDSFFSDFPQRVDRR